MGLQIQNRHFIDLSLPFGLRGVASCCQDVTRLVVKSLKKHGVQAPSYINDFGGVIWDKASEGQHFNYWVPLSRLGLQEAAH